ncbi:MAG: hypothetical protein GKS00_22770 [Alphaproteobacteria bacterium]|nr:hypothetical protein [Alphaproteobacteria bacterium]
MAENQLKNEDYRLKQAGESDAAVTPPMALTLDVEKYEHFFEGEDLTEDQKCEYLQALWNIIVSFIQLGVEVRPASQDCGKPPESADCSAKSADDVIKSKPQYLNDKFVRAADRTHDPQQGGVPDEQ